MWLTSPKDADEIANSVDPDQTASLVFARGPSVCPVRIITVFQANRYSRNPNLLIIGSFTHTQQFLFCIFRENLFYSVTVVFEPPHNKTQKNDLCTQKTQISLGIHPVWADRSFCFVLSWGGSFC